MGEPGVGRMRDRLLLHSGIYRNPFEIFGVDRPDAVCHREALLQQREIGSVQNLSHFRLAERHPALAHAMMAPLICWSFSNSMFRYLLVDHAVPAMWRSLAAARLSADWPSGNAPTTRVRRRISRRMRSSGLLVRIRRQCSSGKA